MTETIYTGTKWLGQRVLIESSGDEDVDDALKSTFHDYLHRTRALDMWRADVKLVLEYSRRGVPVAEAKAGQMGLFEQ